MKPENNLPPPGFYPSTLWTQVIQAIQQGDTDASWAALEQFCVSYRPAIRSFFRRHSRGEDEADDLTQRFFESRIHTRWEKKEGFLFEVERGKAQKFRGFLCCVMWAFLVDERRRQVTARSGGGAVHLPMDETNAAEVHADGESLKKFGNEFDREFALALIAKAAAGATRSKHLLAHLRGEITQKQAAEELGLSENAFKQDYNRFRERLRHNLWQEATKLAGPKVEDIRDELRYLMSLFGADEP